MMTTKKPTGQLASANATIRSMEAKISELVAASEASLELVNIVTAERDAALAQNKRMKTFIRMTYEKFIGDHNVEPSMLTLMRVHNEVPEDTLAQHESEVAARAVDEYKAVNQSVADHLVRQIAFSLKAFGPALRTGGLIDHIRKELVEVEENPYDLSEWIDIAMLALDGAWRHAIRRGRTHEEIAQDVAAALQEKLVKNENRTWPDWRLFSEDKAIEHDRTGESLCKETK